MKKTPQKLKETKNHSSSFRDPSGHIFVENGVFKRKVNASYLDQYNALTTSGFYQELFDRQWLIPHKELSASSAAVVLQPEQIPFITYPYEWSFLQYKEAALLTLKIQNYALKNSFVLKDASAFNLTFHKGKCVFIDTLSFDFYVDNTPWRAFGQFVRHFLGPLLLARYHDASFLKSLLAHLDGIPLTLLSKLLPKSTKLNPFLYANVHLLAKYEQQYNEVKDTSKKPRTIALSLKSQKKIIQGLYDFISKLSYKKSSEWGAYYTKINYSEASFQHKSEILQGWIGQLKPSKIIDIGGNDGTFVRKINQDIGLSLVCDIDTNAVDANFAQIKSGDPTILPFVLDVLNPSPGIGFHHRERDSMIDRLIALDPEVTLALAVIHHMSLSGNIPFAMTSKFFSSFSTYLIIEFPTRKDSWVAHLLHNKREFKSHFDFYNVTNFETAFGEDFEIIEKHEISDAERLLYLLRVKKPERSS